LGFGLWATADGEQFTIVRVLALTVVLVLAGLAAASAQPGGAPRPPEPTPSSDGAGPASAGEPVPVPEPSEKALQYYRSGNVLWALGIVWSMLVPAILLFTGFSSRIRDLAQRVGRNWFFTIAVYSVLLTLVTFVLDLPLAYYIQFVREHAYGLSNQTLGKWTSDTLTALGVGLLFGAALLWIPYLLLKRSPTRWWLYTAMVSIPIIFLMLLILPVWVDPLFNTFGPMKDQALEARILALADRAGIEGGRVYEVQKSVDTKQVNAYVTGFMNTKRIVLWDTLLAKLNADEVLFVMGHEMGHYVLGHVIRTIVVLSLLLLGTLYAAHRLSRGLIARFGWRFGFDRLSDVASLPLLILLTNVLGFLVTPAALAFTRYQEREADRFGLEITQNNRAAATSFVKLQEENLGVPRPGLLVRIWRASHPVLGDRIDFCNTYRPWAEGRPLRYGHVFRAPRDD
jgi:Zn-dependent protease with chaperone function